MIFGSCVRCFANAKPLHVHWDPEGNEETRPLDSRETANTPPAVLAVAARAWADDATVEVQAVSAATTVRRGRPIVPARTAAAN